MKDKGYTEELPELLKNLSREDGYIVPEGYFIQLSDHISSELHLGDINIADDTPEGYFKNLPDVVLTRLQEENQIKVRPLRRWKQGLSIAATLLIAWVIGSSILGQKEVLPEDQGYTIEYFDYLENNIADLELNTLIDLGLVDEEMMADNLSLVDENIMELYLDENIDEINLDFLEELRQ